MKNCKVQHGIIECLQANSSTLFWLCSCQCLKVRSTGDIRNGTQSKDISLVDLGHDLAVLTLVATDRNKQKSRSACAGNCGQRSRTDLSSQDKGWHMRNCKDIQQVREQGWALGSQVSAKLPRHVAGSLHTLLREVNSARNNVESGNFKTILCQEDCLDMLGWTKPLTEDALNGKRPVSSNGHAELHTKVRDTFPSTNIFMAVCDRRSTRCMCSNVAFSAAPQPTSNTRGPSTSPDAGRRRNGRAGTACNRGKMQRKGSRKQGQHCTRDTPILGKKPSDKATARAGCGIPTSQGAPSGACCPLQRGFASSR